MKRSSIIVPEGCSEVLLHACCAPCSSAIVEWLVAHNVTPVIYYYNPNIYPFDEYEKRKNESKRHAESLGLKWIDQDDVQRDKGKCTKEVRMSNYDELHRQWRHDICGWETEPERGKRCEICFYHRLLATARMAQSLGMTFFGTTLASSRWKSLDQINAAGERAAAAVQGVTFWAQNWRKDGLQERRNELIKEYCFYNQLYCGCEYSIRV